VAHFLSEPRVRSALIRQLLTSHARATLPTVPGAALPWPELPPGDGEHRVVFQSLEATKNGQFFIVENLYAMTDPWCWYINANIKGVY
jgi:hypothetical protein